MDSATFLRDYYNCQQKLTTNVKFPKNIEIWLKSRPNKSTDYASVFAYTVLNRVIFLQFLGINNQILPEAFLQHYLQKCKKGDSLYRDWLAPLWFEILTVPTKKRNLDLIPSELKELPFLNAALFVPLNHIEKENTTWLYPTLEIVNEVTIWQEILLILAQYTWCFDEAQIGKVNCITPAILGRVFEKLCTFQKGTGSYYTPIEITEFMTEHWCASYVSQFLKVPQDNVNQKLKIIDNITQNLVHEKKEVEFLDLLLHSLKICDNSCGSGAYLISFFSFLTRLAMYLCNLPSLSSKISEILSEKEKDQMHFLSSIIQRPLSYFLMYHTLQNNLYGVDIQTESVQITRYRLWLSLLPFISSPFCKKCNDQDFSPLPDLQNNIQCGNSLLGFHEIGQLKTINPEIVKKYPFVKNLLSQSKNDSFIQNIDDLRKELNDLFRELHDINLETTIDHDEPMQLFHWIVEFPAVFFRKNPGFDLILGNPPYIRQEHINNLLGQLNYKSLLQALYPSSHSLFDFSNYFILRSLQLTRPSGFHSYIITNKWLKTRYGQTIRSLLRNQTKIWEFNDLSSLNVFVGANVSTIIYLIEKSVPSPQDHLTFRAPSNLTQLYTGGFEVLQSSLSDQHWAFLNTEEQQIKEYIEHQGPTIKDHRIKIYSGIKTGYNSAFLISGKVKKDLIYQNPKLASHLKPLVRGKEIFPFSFKWNDQWLISFPFGFTKSHIQHTTDADSWFKSEYSEIYSYFTSLPTDKGKGNGLKQREDQGDYWWELRPCDYYSALDRPKIIWQEISEQGSYAWDTHGLYVLNTCYFMPDVPKYYLLILNSPLMNYYFSLISADIGDKGTRHTYQYIERIPLKISEDSELMNILTDYVLFTSQNREKFETNTIQFLLKIANFVVYEHYIGDFFIRDSSPPIKKTLITQLATYLLPIAYDVWAEKEWAMKFNSIPNSENNFNELTPSLLSMVKKCVENLLQSNQISNHLAWIGSHEWIQIIEARIH